MSINYEKLFEIIDKEKVITDSNLLRELYCKPILEKTSDIPILSILPENSEQISKLIRYFRTLNNINIVVISSTTSPKFLNDTVCHGKVIFLDLHNMKQIPFINKRNRVCVVEPGVTWEELIPKLKEHGLRPLAPFLPRPGKSALASVLDREPHLIAKRQWDISDPLLCMEVIFGNGEIFRTGEAAGPLDLEANRKFGAALTNPLGPGQTDIFRIIQGSKGTYGIVSWISMQCDFIPDKRVIRSIHSDSITPLTEFIYSAVRKRWIDEVFIINYNLVKTIFPSINGNIKKYIMIYAINGYEFFPDDKISYQMECCEGILSGLGLEAKDNISGITQNEIEPLLDGGTIDPHPKFSETTIALDIFYNTTLDRIQTHLKGAVEILNKHDFPMDRVNIYIQPVIQARAVNIEFSIIADRPDSDKIEYSLERVRAVCKEIGQFAALNGGFFSRSYELINGIAFTDKNQVFQEGLRKLKRIFDPDMILNKGQLIF